MGVTVVNIGLNVNFSGTAGATAEIAVGQESTSDHYCVPLGDVTNTTVKDAWASIVDAGNDASNQSEFDTAVIDALDTIDGTGALSTKYSAIPVAQRLKLWGQCGWLHGKSWYL